QDPESESVSDQQPAVPSDPAPAAANPENAAMGSTLHDTGASGSVDEQGASSTATEQGAPGTFDEQGVYTPRQVVADDLGVSFDEAVASTMVEVEDGQIVHGRVVKIDKDEVLLDIGYKSE